MKRVTIIDLDEEDYIDSWILEYNEDNKRIRCDDTKKSFIIHVRGKIQFQNPVEWRIGIVWIPLGYHVSVPIGDDHKISLEILRDVHDNSPRYTLRVTKSMIELCYENVVEIDMIFKSVCRDHFPKVRGSWLRFFGLHECNDSNETKYQERQWCGNKKLFLDFPDLIENHPGLLLL